MRPRPVVKTGHLACGRHFSGSQNCHLAASLLGMPGSN